MNSKGTIMVVDDTHASLKLLIEYLSEEGYNVHAADSGKLALASVAQNPPELILLDIRMPGMDGFEVLRQLKARPESRDIPVIFLSAVTEIEQRVEGLNLGAVDFISKPFQRDELTARVKTHLELFRLRIQSEMQAKDLQRINEQLTGEILERRQAEEHLKHFNEELEQQVKSRTKDLNASLDEKVILLREIHHRVKNNLQILISLLNLQSRTINDPQIKTALKESTQRIRAMSMVHEKLYSGTDLAHIDFAGYLSSLAKAQVEFYQMGPSKVRLEITGDKIMLDINTAIPLGLVMNELLSNALKHAFPGDRKGTIRIDVRRMEDRLEISIADDGVGLPEGFDSTTSPSLGLRLVHILIEQIQGTIELDRTTGTKFNIVVKEKK